MLIKKMKEKNLVKTFVLLFLLIVFFQSNLVFAGAFNNSICENESLGTYLLGDDYYIICESNFVEDYYAGTSINGTVQNPLVEYKEISRFPQSPTDYFILEELGIKPLAVRPDVLEEINTKIKNFTVLESKKQINQNIDNNSQNTFSQEKNKSKNLSNNHFLLNESRENSSDFNQNKQNKDSSFFLKDDDEESGSRTSSSYGLKNYFLYVATGLFILFIIYIVIHLFSISKTKTQQIEMLRKYVETLRQHNLSDIKIKNYIKNKGYEEDLIAKVFKTLDKKP